MTCLESSIPRSVSLDRITGIPHSGSERDIDPHPEWGGISRFVISPDEAVLALKSHGRWSSGLEGRQLRDVSDVYLRQMAQEPDGKSVDS